MEIKGVVKDITEKLTGTSNGKGWSKYAIILDTGNEHNPLIAVDVFNEKVTAKIGDTVNISINLSSREYNGKWYTNCSAWKLEQVANDSESKEENSDDMPF